MTAAAPYRNNVAPDATDDVLNPNELLPVTNRGMHARRHPIVLLVWWAWQLLFGLLTAWPMYSVARAAFGRNPDGDLLAWTNGGLDLLDLLVRADTWTAAIPAHAAIVLFAGAVLGHVPLAATIAAVAYARRDKKSATARQILGRARRAFWPMISVFLIATLAQAALIGLGAGAYGMLDSALTASLGDARASQIAGALGLAFAFLVAIAGVLHDLARVAIVRFRVGAVEALRVAWRTFRRGKSTIVWSWMWRGAAGLVPLAVGAMVADKIGGEGGLTLLVLAVAHQGVVLVRLALRASWLAKALRRTDAVHEVKMPKRA